jgi:hypothetical protein
MRRREFVTLLGGAVAWPLIAQGSRRRCECPDTLFCLNDDYAAAEIGCNYGPRGLAAEPWPRTI